MVKQNKYLPHIRSQISSLTCSFVTNWIQCYRIITKLITAWKVSKYRVFSGPYITAFELNTERYSLSLRIQSECGKIRNRKSSVLGDFSRSVFAGVFTLARRFVNSCGWNFWTSPSCFAAVFLVAGVEPVSRINSSLSSLQHLVFLLLKVYS